MVKTVLHKNKCYANVQGHIETNSFQIQSNLLQEQKSNQFNFKLTTQILNVIKSEKLEKNYINNKKIIIDKCTKNAHVLKKKNKLCVLRYKKTIQNIIMSKQMRATINYEEIK